MKTWKTVVAFVTAIDMASCPLIMADCQDQAASTSLDPLCDPLFCPAKDCLGAWTINTPLWCKPSPGYNCDTESYNPPVYITVNYTMGTCGLVGDDCKCVVPPGGTWSDVQETFWYQSTSPCST
jgi:hypothetical protein